MSITRRSKGARHVPDLGQAPRSALLVLAGGLVLLPVARAAGGLQEPASCRVVRLSDIGWTAESVATAVFAKLLSDLGYAQLRAGQIEDARLPLMQALQLRPDSTQAQANLALYLEVTNQRDQATALMDANRMSETTRMAVREAAQQLRAPGGLAAPIVAAAPASTRGEPIVAPLALKPSRWTGAGGTRTAIQTNPPASNAEAPFSPNSIPRGTP